MKSHTCCFVGHRKLPQDEIEEIAVRLHQEMDRPSAQGVTDFLSGGALGFDQIAASLVIAKREMGCDIRLILVLPYKDQDVRWTMEQRHLFRNLILEADEITYVSEKRAAGCIKRRNQYMIDRSAYCLCALLDPCSGVGQTTEYAHRKGLEVVNVAE